jgi:hypothetical protein
MQKVSGTFRPADVAYVEGLLTALLTGESVCNYTTGKTGKRVLAKFQRMRDRLNGRYGTVRYNPALTELSKMQLAGLHGIFSWAELGTLIGARRWKIRSAVRLWQERQRQLPVEEPMQLADAAE